MAAPKGNKYAVGNKGGSPAFFKTPEEMQKAVDKYFATEIPTKYTVCGLTLALGFSDVQSLLNYQKKDMFYDIVKKAKLRIAQSYEESLRRTSASGDMFILKNLGFRDRQETENVNHDNIVIKWEQ
jgi:hypothetical protein